MKQITRRAILFVLLGSTHSIHAGLLLEENNSTWYTSTCEMSDTAWLYTVDTATHSLFGINVCDATATKVAELDHSAYYAGLTYDPVADVIFASALYTGSLYQIDYHTGALTEIGQMAPPYIHGLAYDSSTKTLFGTYGDYAQDILYRIDVTTGDALPIGHIGIFDNNRSVVGLAVHPHTHELYGIIGSLLANMSSLVHIDTLTGQGKRIAAYAAPRLQSLAFHPDTGIPYAMSNIDGSLYKLDIHSNAITLIGNTELKYPLGSTFIPEPATVLIMGMGIIVLIRQRY